MFVLAGLALVRFPAYAQGAARGPGASPKAAAPFDITGYWVSVITQNWRFRMVTPAKGDYIGIPMIPAAKEIADKWDPRKQEASGDQCKGYGAALIMTLPERLRITWQDDSTLKMDIDSGIQTRVFHFGKRAAAKQRCKAIPSRNGYRGVVLVSHRAPRQPGI
jgi:hypothetical protein